MEELGGEIQITAATSEKEYWQFHNNLPNIQTFAARLHKKVPPVQWLIVTNVQEYGSQAKNQALSQVLHQAIAHGAEQVMLIWPFQPQIQQQEHWKEQLRRAMKGKDMESASMTIQGQQSQANVNTTHFILMAAARKVIKNWTEAAEKSDKYAGEGNIANILDDSNKSYKGYFNLEKLTPKQVISRNAEGITTSKTPNP